MNNKIIYLSLVTWFMVTMLNAQVHSDTAKSSFEFVFMTDIHLRPDMDAPKGYKMAIDATNQLNPDFVLTGGDLIFDALRGNQNRSDSLFILFVEMSKGFNMLLYPCIGNHDLFAVYEESPENESHPDYKYGMFERYFGNTYYSFDHKGWKFIVLNSLDVTEDKRYKGYVNDIQIEWLKKELLNMNKSTPIVIVTHIPLICTWQFVNGGSRTVDNATEVLQLFSDHNLKLVLQGHIHWKEHGFINDRFHFITGGSIAGNGWKGRRHNTKEGFVHLKVNGEDISWEYVDHGWEEERLRLQSLSR